MRRREKQRDQRCADEERAIGSSTVRLPIHAPLNPKAIKTSGPVQQADAEWRPAHRRRARRARFVVQTFVVQTYACPFKFGLIA